MPALILLLASGFLLFPWWLVVVEIILGVSVYSSLQESPAKAQSPRDGILTWVWFLVMLLSIAIHIFPFSFSQTPLGYDTGIYRYEILSSFQALPEYVSGLFLGLPLVTNVALLFGVGVDQLLTVGYGLIALIVALSLSFLSDRWWGRREALAALLFFTISLVQWKAYEMILVKQLLAMALVFLSCWLFKRRSLLVLIPLAFVTLLQPLDAVLVGISALGYAVLSSLQDRDDRRYFATLFLIGGAAALALLISDAGYWTVLWQQFSQGLADPTQIDLSLQKGVFITLEDFGYQSAFFFVFGVIGWLIEIRSRRATITSLYFLVLLLWIMLRLFFYQRLLIQLDAMLIFYSALSVVRFVESFAHDRMGKILAVAVLLGMSAPFVMTLARFEPLVSATELARIETFCGQLDSGVYVAATDSYYAPWLKGYCLGQRAFGPGIFPDNHWSRSDWESIWKGDREKIAALLKQVDGPLYFYIGENQVQIELNPEQFEWVSKGWWRAGPPAGGV